MCLALARCLPPVAAKIAEICSKSVCTPQAYFLHVEKVGKAPPRGKPPGNPFLGECPCGVPEGQTALRQLLERAQNHLPSVHLPAHATRQTDSAVCAAESDLSLWCGGNMRAAPRGVGSLPRQGELAESQERVAWARAEPPSKMSLWVWGF